MVKKRSARRRERKRNKKKKNDTANQSTFAFGAEAEGADALPDVAAEQPPTLTEETAGGDSAPATQRDVAVKQTTVSTEETAVEDATQSDCFVKQTSVSTEETAAEESAPAAQRDVAVHFDLNVDDGSTSDPAADVVHLTEIGTELAELDGQNETAAANDDYELADSLDNQQNALKAEREAITARLSEARATAVDSKAKCEKELAALDGEVQAAAEAEDYDRAEQLDEKMNEVRQHMKETAKVSLTTLTLTLNPKP